MVKLWSILSILGGSSENREENKNVNEVEYDENKIETEETESWRKCVLAIFLCNNIGNCLIVILPLYIK